MIPQFGKLYSIKEAAPLLGVERDSVSRLIRRGKLKCVELPQMGGRGKNKKRLIPEAEIDRFLRENFNGFLISVQ
jgi:excisionase family DNA binding protein